MPISDLVVQLQIYRPSFTRKLFFLYLQLKLIDNVINLIRSHVCKNTFSYEGLAETSHICNVISTITVEKWKNYQITCSYMAALRFLTALIENYQ